MAKKGYSKDVAAETLKNNNFRKVLYTGEHLQLVLMTLQPGEACPPSTSDEVVVWSARDFRRRAEWIEGRSS